MKTQKKLINQLFSRRLQNTYDIVKTQSASNNERVNTVFTDTFSKFLYVSQNKS